MTIVLERARAPVIPKEIISYIDNLLGRSPKTKSNYESFARVFWSFMKDKSINDITVEDIMTFLQEGVQNHGWKLTTMKQYATLAMSFFGEFRDETFVKRLRKQMKQLPRPQSKASLYEGIYVPPNKIDSFVSFAVDEEWAVFYTMLLKWGLRIGEALNITPSDINVEKNRIVVRGKGIGGFGKIRQVFVEKSTITRVLKFAKCSEEQINGQKAIRNTSPIIQRIKTRAAEYAVKLTAKEIGLEFWKQLTPHDLRHSYAIDFLTKRKKQGMAALVMLKNQLGHTNINVTQIYLDISGGEAQEVFDAGIDK